MLKLKRKSLRLHLLSISLVLTLGLTGCVSTTKPPPEFFQLPEAPANINTRCPDLEKAVLNEQGTFTASDALHLSNRNNSKYLNCQNKNDLWMEFYAEQKKKEKEMIQKLKEIK